MSLPKENMRLSVADYLAGERDAAVRHEYVEGYAYAMAGGNAAGVSACHNRIAGNIFARLNESRWRGVRAVYFGYED